MSLLLLMLPTHAIIYVTVKSVSFRHMWFMFCGQKASSESVRIYFLYRLCKRLRKFCCNTSHFWNPDLTAVFVEALNVASQLIGCTNSGRVEVVCLCVVVGPCAWVLVLVKAAGSQVGWWWWQDFDYINCNHMMAACASWRVVARPHAFTRLSTSPTFSIHIACGH